MAYINCSGVQLGAQVQGTFALTKVLALTVIIVAGVQHLAKGRIEHFHRPLQGTIWDTASLATACYSTLFAYSGWYSLNTVAEELQEPNKNLPRALSLSMVLVTLIYALTNMAYYAVLSPAEILSSSAVAVTFANRMLGALGWVIAVSVACSTCGSINGSLFVLSREVFAGAREGHMPRLLGLIQVDQCTPVTAIIFVAAVPLLMLTVHDFEGLLAYFGFTSNLVNLTAVAGLLWLRYQDPGRPRPIKVWLGFPMVYLAVSVLVAVFPVVVLPLETSVSLVFIVSLLAFYYLVIATPKDTTPTLLTDTMDKVTYVSQVMLKCSPEQCQPEAHRSCSETATLKQLH